MEVSGYFQVGDVDGSKVTDNAVQMGYSSAGTAGFLQAYKNSTSAFIQLNISGSKIVLGQGNTEPDQTNARNLGAAGKTWKDIYSQNAVTVVSNELLKDFEEFQSEHIALTRDLKAAIRPYRWKAEPKKLHFGISAQKVYELCAKHGIDPDACALVSREEHDGEVFWGVNYNDLYACLLGTT